MHVALQRSGGSAAGPRGMSAEHARLHALVDMFCHGCQLTRNLLVWWLLADQFCCDWQLTLQASRH